MTQNSDTSVTDDQRAHARESGDRTIVAQLLGENDEPQLMLDNARLLDFSPGGMAIATSSGLMPGTRLLIQIADSNPNHTPQSNDDPLPPGRQIKLEVLGCAIHQARCYKLRCAVLETMPVAS